MISYKNGYLQASSWIVDRELCETDGVLHLNTVDLTEPGVIWMEYYDYSWNNVSTITAMCGRESIKHLRHWSVKIRFSFNCPVMSLFCWVDKTFSFGLA